MIQMSIRPWFEEVKNHRVATIAQATSLTIGKTNDLSPCPACGLEQRGRSDRRGPVGITPDGMGWRCHRCGAGGNAITLIALRVLKVSTTKGLSIQHWQDVWSWCLKNGFCSSAGNPSDNSGSNPQKISAMPRPRPPANEVHYVWNVSRTVDQDADVLDWIENRKLEASVIVERDLARALPQNLELPYWCSFRGRPWNESGHRLIVKMFGASGEMESLHARCILPNVAASDKAAAPAAGPGSISGLVMADLLGIILLRRGLPPEWWPNIPLQIVVTEGEPDFLTWATRYGDAAESAPAVLGIVAGSWTTGIAGRVPDGARVVIRTHSDDAGNKYAGEIFSSLAARCTALRPLN